MANKESDILLESGTGELEVLKFKVKGVYYAINVIKVKEILEINYDEVEPLPSQPSAVRGVTNVRGEAVTVIDLTGYLDCERAESKPEKKNPNESYMILTEFNQMKTLFAVDEVIEIERIKWSDIDEPNQLMGELVNGVIRLDGQLINFLDFEKIMADLRPRLSMSATGSEGYEAEHEYKEEREDIKLAMAEDSPTIRNILKGVLKESGYTNLKVFNDGEGLWNYLMEFKEEDGGEGTICDHVQGIITDIEMPQLDGHTLIRSIREDRYFRDLPAMIFSSLITENLRHKGEEVGANAQISKPEIDNLIVEMDQLVLDE